MKIEQEAKMLIFSEYGDDRGKLVVAEENKDIPFEIKRVFYIYGTEKGVVRGQHANYRSEFVLINLSGTSRVKVKNGRGKEVVFCLDKPHIGIYIPRLLWKEMYDFSSDSVLLVLASEHYNADEYIRNYNDFLHIVNEGREINH